MATATKALARGAYATSSTTLYTVPASTTTIVTSIAVCNTSASAQTFDIYLNGVEMFTGAAIAAKSTAVIDVKQVLAATQIIAGLASASSVKFHISGVEIS